jgi:hypothetical protein
MARGGDPRGFTIPVGGGVATFVEAGSPFYKVAGLGFGAVPETDALDQFEQAFAAVGCSVQAEVSILGVVSLCRLSLTSN